MTRFHRVLPASSFRGKQAGTVVVPDWIIAQELAAGAAEHRPISLAANLVGRRIVLALVSGLDEDEGAYRTAWYSACTGRNKVFS